MNPGLGVENRLDAPEAPGRVLDPLHRHALPARRRGGDGVLGQLGGVAPLGVGRRLLLPEALRDVRAGGHGAPPAGIAARPQGDPRAHAAALDVVVRPDGGRDAAGRWRDGERRHALARGRAAPVPAVGAPEGGAGALRGAAARRAAAVHPQRGDAHEAAAARGGRGVCPADEAAGHGHHHGDLLFDRGAAGGGRGADAQPRC